MVKTITLKPFCRKQELREVLDAKSLKKAFPLIFSKDASIHQMIVELEKMSSMTNYIVLSVFNLYNILIGVIVIERKKEKAILHYALGNYYKKDTYQVIKTAIQYLQDNHSFDSIEIEQEEKMQTKNKRVENSFLENPALNFKKRFVRTSKKNRKTIIFSKSLKKAT